MNVSYIHGAATTDFFLSLQAENIHNDKLESKIYSRNTIWFKRLHQTELWQYGSWRSLNHKKLYSKNSWPLWGKYSWYWNQCQLEIFGTPIARVLAFLTLLLGWSCCLHSCRSCRSRVPWWILFTKIQMLTNKLN